MDFRRSPAPPVEPLSTRVFNEGSLGSYPTSSSAEILGSDLSYTQDVSVMSSYDILRKCWPKQIMYWRGDSTTQYDIAMQPASTSEFEDLLTMWTNHLAGTGFRLPELENQLEVVWQRKKPTLQKLVESVSRPRWPVSQLLKMDDEMVNRTIPIEERGPHFWFLSQSMKDAFENGMSSGRAKYFLAALSEYLLHDDFPPHLYLHNHIRLQAVEARDPVAGQVRFMSTINFPSCIAFPGEDTYRKTTKAASATTVSSASASSYSSATKSRRIKVPKDEQVYTISADAAITLNNQLFFICVFEFTRAFETSHAVKQNFHQMLSMFHHQKAMFGLVLNSKGYSIQLVLKEREAIKFYSTTEYVFCDSSGGMHKLGTNAFLMMAKSIYMMMYTATQLLRLQQQGVQQ